MLNQNDENMSLEKAMVEFMPTAIEEEVKRGLLMHHTYMKHDSIACRVYSDDEQQKIPLAGRAYLLELEQARDISPIQRDWIIESVLVRANLMELDCVPLSLLVATVFIVKLIKQTILDPDAPMRVPTWSEISAKLH